MNRFERGRPLSGRSEEMKRGMWISARCIAQRRSQRPVIHQPQSLPLCDQRIRHLRDIAHASILSLVYAREGGGTLCPASTPERLV
jgi:hypothetical protein